MIDITQSQQDIEKQILRSIVKYTPQHEFQEVYKYSLIPAGKLFRPLLVRSIALDLGNHKTCHKFLECFVETHHVYTLIHDDLPCMDDDKERRGRASSHIKFNEWKALLAGDGLLNLSFHLISHIESNTSQLLKYLSWCTGPKGLIHGQVLDLSLEMTKDFKSLIQTHTLKTSRLIQSAIVGSAIINNAPFNTIKDLHRLSLHLGITFQLLDDLCELTEKEVSSHEQDVNPFFKFQSLIYTELASRLEEIEKLLDKYKLSNTSVVLNNYFSKVHETCVNGKDFLEDRLNPAELGPIMNILNRLSLTNNTL